MSKWKHPEGVASAPPPKRLGDIQSRSERVSRIMEIGNELGMDMFDTIKDRIYDEGGGDGDAACALITAARALLLASAYFELAHGGQTTKAVAAVDRITKEMSELKR